MQDFITSAHKRGNKCNVGREYPCGPRPPTYWFSKPSHRKTGTVETATAKCNPQDIEMAGVDDDTYTRAPSINSQIDRRGPVVAPTSALALNSPMKAL